MDFSHAGAQLAGQTSKPLPEYYMTLASVSLEVWPQVHRKSHLLEGLASFKWNAHLNAVIVNFTAVPWHIM